MPFKSITTASDFQSAVKMGETPETRLLEFKSEYRWRKAIHKPENMADQAEELCRDVAQFANLDGGTLLIGVKERDPGDGHKVAVGIQTVVNVDGFKQWAEDAIRKHLAPSTFSRSLDVIVLPEGHILAINIPPSLHLLAVWHPARKKGIEYVFRTDHGKQWMNPDEVERHIMNGSRAMKIQLDRVFEGVSNATNGGNASNVGNVSFRAELTPPLKKRLFDFVEMQPRMTTRVVPGDDDVFVKRVAGSDQEIELHVNRRTIRLPHGLISEAWITGENRVGLYLKVAVVVQPGDDLALEQSTS